MWAAEDLFYSSMSEQFLLRLFLVLRFRPFGPFERCGLNERIPRFIQGVDVDHGLAYIIIIDEERVNIQIYARRWICYGIK